MKLPTSLLWFFFPLKWHKINLLNKQKKGLLGSPQHQQMPEIIVRLSHLLSVVAFPQNLVGDETLVQKTEFTIFP